MFDFIGFIETHSALATVAVILGVAVLWLASRELRDLCRRASATHESVLRQEQAIRDEETQAIVYRKEILQTVADLCEIIEDLRKKAETHYSDVQRLADDDHWKNCQVDKCPNLPNILSSCKQTNEALTEIATGLRQLSFEMIATLRSFRNGGSKRSGHDAV